MCAGRMSFGGGWTDDKLHRLGEYLKAYVTALKHKPFELVYIDAFAGTGYRELKDESSGGTLFRELAEEEPQGFLDGSARIACSVDPPFDRYIFIERSASRAAHLRELRHEMPRLAGRITVDVADCNDYLPGLCTDIDWDRCRAVLFLDPFGMQVDWSTREAVARTRAIDVWMLFPLSAVNRLLERTGQIPAERRDKLNRLFGDEGWHSRFYSEEAVPDLFAGERRVVRKRGSFRAIASYVNERLSSIFAGVAENPRLLCNSTGSPLFLLCFAVANPQPKALGLALRIASHILGD
jgi:three-Cys-motif partner protein